jgi:hypothetical protein
VSSSKPYQEEESSTFQNGDKVYNLNTLFKLTQNEDVKHIAISELDWIFDPENNLGSFDDTDQRTKNADYSVPILVAKFDNQEVVIDGLHRLSKAIKVKLKDMPYKRVTQAMLGKALVVQAKESQVDKPPFSSWV